MVVVVVIEEEVDLVIYKVLPRNGYIQDAPPRVQNMKTLLTTQEEEYAHIEPSAG